METKKYVLWYLAIPEEHVQKINNMPDFVCPTDRCEDCTLFTTCPLTDELVTKYYLLLYDDYETAKVKIFTLQISIEVISIVFIDIEKEIGFLYKMDSSLNIEGFSKHMLPTIQKSIWDDYTIDIFIKKVNDLRTVETYSISNGYFDREFSVFFFVFSFQPKKTGRNSPRLLSSYFFRV